MGYASSRAQARLLVTHGHFHRERPPHRCPSMLVSPGDVIEVREGSRKPTLLQRTA
jgi:small subunit ribosomal protein S4